MEDQEQSRNDRARFPIEVRDIYYKLTQGTDPEQMPFETLKDVFMFAACIGFKKNLRKPLEAGPKTDMRMEVFSDKDKNIMRSMAIAEIGNVDVLNKSSDELISGKVLDIVEEYAYGGILEIKASIIDQPGATLWNLIDFLKMQAK